MDLYNSKGFFDEFKCGEWMGGGGGGGGGGGLIYGITINLVISIFQFSNFNFSCNVKLLQTIITAQELRAS